MGVNRKVVLADKMSMHFAEVGRVQTRQEYTRTGGGPYTPQEIVRVAGSWNRMVGLCRRLFPDRLTEFTEVAQAAVVETPVEPVVEPQVEIPARTENPSVQTAADALARLRESKE